MTGEDVRLNAGIILHYTACQTLENTLKTSSTTSDVVVVELPGPVRTVKLERSCIST